MDTGRVVVIEAGWLGRVCACTLFLYELPLGSFELWDESAGYWVSRQTVVPLGVTVVKVLPSAITDGMANCESRIYCGQCTTM